MGYTYDFFDEDMVEITEKNTKFLLNLTNYIFTTIYNLIDLQQIQQD